MDIKTDPRSLTPDTQKISIPLKEAQSGKHVEAPTQIEQKKDYSVKVSDRAKDMSRAFDKAFQIAKNTNPIREDRVLDLKKRIENGTYHVSAEDIAESIVRDSIYENMSYES